MNHLQRFGLFIVIASTGVLLGAQSSALYAAGRAPAHSASAKKNGHASAKLLLGFLNADRKLHGAAPLTLSLKQSKCSAKHTWAMVRLGHISHTVAPAFPADICIHASHAAGENIGVWYGKPAVALKALNASMFAEGPCPSACPKNSKLWFLHDHYLNIIDKAYTTVGLGIVYKNNHTWLTETFIG